MHFSLPNYRPPDFNKEKFKSAPDVMFEPAPADFVAPEQYHATTIFPEYFNVGGNWPENTADTCLPNFSSASAKPSAAVSWSTDGLRDTVTKILDF